MKNKILLILLVLSFTLFALGSGSSKENKNNETSNVSTKDEIKVDEEIKTIPTIEETLILDESGIKVTAVEMVDDSIWGPGLKVLIENDSNKDVTVTASAMAINGYMFTDFLYETVTAGQKAYETIHSFSSDLKEAGIENIGEIAIWFRLVDASSYKEIYEADDPVIIKTSLYDEIDRNIDVEGVEVVNQDGVKVIVKYVDENSFWGTSVLVYVENNSGHDILISSEDVSVNGFMINALYSVDIKDGYKSFDTMTFFSSDLEENNISSIETIKMNFRCIDYNTFRTIFESDPINVDIN